MKQAEVIPGRIYLAKVSGHLTFVQIVRAHSIARGWHAVNLRTLRDIHIRSAQRLRREAIEAELRMLSPAVPFVQLSSGKPLENFLQAVENVANKL